MSTNKQNRHPNREVAKEHCLLHGPNPNQQRNPIIHFKVKLSFCLVIGVRAPYLFMANACNLFNFKQLSRVILDAAKHDQGNLMVVTNRLNDVLSA